MKRDTARHAAARSGHREASWSPGGGDCLEHLGIVEWFHLGDHERVLSAVEDLKKLGIRRLRTGISWADWHRPGAEQWFEWLVPLLGKEFELLPCVLYTPPSLGIEPKSSSPPRQPKAFADFVDLIITRFGEHFDWMELWNEPNNGCEWDWTLDPNWDRFGEMIGGAAYWARERGKKIALGGMSPVDPNWLECMFNRGVMEHIDAVGIHGFPGTFDYDWPGWVASVSRVRDVLERHGSAAQIWITETGYSTWRHDEHRQLESLLGALEAPVERVYWYGLRDLHPERPTVEGFRSDQREYHFGMQHSDGMPKLLYRLWAEGDIGRVRHLCHLKDSAPTRAVRKPRVLITGGAGFIGTNLADRLLISGTPVLIFDNLSRPGVEHNLHWLISRHGDNLDVQVADIRDSFAVKEAVRTARHVFHFAAQVAVTSSLANPRHDFDVNALGALNVLEAARLAEDPPSVVFTSTNKVYGALEHVDLLRTGDAYEPLNPALGKNGVSEEMSVDFHSPYGCSKGAAEQYVLDYARSFGLRTAVFRMSCIYGPHQFGTEDQGWVAHFLIRSLHEEAITLYGDGRQVRDILFVDDLVRALVLAYEKIDALSGEAFNIGGGPDNAVSLLQVVEMISHLRGREAPVNYSDWRVGDQKYYVSDTRRFRAATGWEPATSAGEGISQLHKWLIEAMKVRMPVFA